MKKKVKGQHYVPRMYLKRFADNSGCLTVYFLEEKKMLCGQRCENYAKKRYFYDADPDTTEAIKEYLVRVVGDGYSRTFEEEQPFETILSRSEMNAEKIINGINDGTLSIEDIDIKVRVCKFLHEMSWRTEKMWALGDHLSTNIKDSIQKFNLDQADYQKIVDQVNPKRNQLNLIFNPEYFIQTAQILIDEYDWYLVELTGKQNFVISDNPMEMVFTRLNEICFPITNRKAIILRTRNKDGRILSTETPINGTIQLSEWSVCKFNLVQLQQAHRYIFGDEFSIQCMLDMAVFIANGRKQELEINE